ncbi:hypothetical protein FZZ93_02280 [Halomonas eurihalina]|uniref:Uncharacterized protein n=1 Tax=Halomonas eurihalina TaxID=42566 RepID=A0A5D9DFF2_HALER|nr:hypothetical protein [Halomonas eurihalina]MDR5857978.1 hypothetical protein [Halomonas eurihalina]TZG41511.1 hypothetical protein FZZ93_02280 [Halomonas eurihalina]
MPDDVATWLKIIGAVSTAVGSILLAWRVKEILKWVVYCLVAHEQSLEQVRRLLSNQQQTEPMVGGGTKHLLDIESRLGVALLVTGFIFLALGMLATAASFFFGQSVTNV